MNRLLPLLIPLLVAVPVSAQDIGFQVGVARTSLWAPDLPLEPDANANFTGGVVVRLPVVMTGMMYARRSAGFTISGMVDGQPESVAARMSMAYLEFPVLGRYGRPAGDGRVVRWLIGPVFAFKLDCNAEAVSRTGMVETDCSDGVGFETKAFDLGLAFGMGFAFNAGFGSGLVADVVYTVGLTSFVERDTVKHRSLTFHLGFSP